MLSSKRLQTVPITNQSAPNKSAETIANNNDLIAEILVRLPVKSLLRFKSVSKGWYSLISDPNFSRRLLPDSVFGLFLTKTRLQYKFVPLSKKSFDAPFKSLTFDDNPGGLTILESCNGLLCCTCIYAYSSKHDYYIYNPTTKQLFKLPQLPIEDTITIYGVGLAFDPAKSPHYKVVFIREPHIQVDFSDPVESSDYRSYQIEIYSSQTGSCRISGNPFVEPFGTCFKGGVYCNGAIHWIDDWHISLYFNVDEEKLGEIPTMPPIPEAWEEIGRLQYFGESRNHLHLIKIYGPCTTQFNIYEMESNYSSWFVKYHVNLDAIPTAFPEMIRSHLDPSDWRYYLFSILSVVREANDEESYMVLHIPGKVIHYNLKDGNFKRICDLASDDDNMDGIPIQTWLR